VENPETGPAPGSLSKALHNPAEDLTAARARNAYIEVVATRSFFAMTALTYPNREGQSAAAKAFIAHRQAVDQAIAASELRQTERAREMRAELEARTGESPVLLVIGILFTVAILVAGFFWYLDRAQCDPVISDRAYSAECRSIR